MRYKVEDEAREQCVKTRAICEDEARRRDEVQRQEAQRCRGIIVCTTKAGKGIPRHRDCRCAGAMHRRRIQFGIGGARRHGDCQRIGGFVGRVRLQVIYSIYQISIHVASTKYYYMK